MTEFAAGVPLWCAWSDGHWYKGTVKAKCSDNPVTYHVDYTEFEEEGWLPPQCLKVDTGPESKPEFSEAILSHFVQPDNYFDEEAAPEKSMAKVKSNKKKKDSLKKKKAHEPPPIPIKQNGSRNCTMAVYWAMKNEKAAPTPAPTVQTKSPPPAPSSSANSVSPNSAGNFAASKKFAAPRTTATFTKAPYAEAKENSKTLPTTSTTTSSIPLILESSSSSPSGSVANPSPSSSSSKPPPVPSSASPTTATHIKNVPSSVTSTANSSSTGGGATFGAGRSFSGSVTPADNPLETLAKAREALANKKKQNDMAATEQYEPVVEEKKFTSAFSKFGSPKPANVSSSSSSSSSSPSAGGGNRFSGRGGGVVRSGVNQVSRGGLAARFDSSSAGGSNTCSKCDTPRKGLCKFCEECGTPY